MIYNREQQLNFSLHNINDIIKKSEMIKLSDYIFTRCYRQRLNKHIYWLLHLIIYSIELHRKIL